MENSKRVPVKQAADELGMGLSEVRIRMRRNMFDPPIGRTMKSLSGRQTRYYIYRDMLDNYMQCGNIQKS